MHGHWRKRAGAGSGGKVAGDDSVGGVGGRCKICACGRGGLAAVDEEKKSRGILEVSSVCNGPVMGRGAGRERTGWVGWGEGVRGIEVLVED